MQTNFLFSMHSLKWRCLNIALKMKVERVPQLIQGYLKQVDFIKFQRQRYLSHFRRTKIHVEFIILKNNKDCFSAKSFCIRCKALSHLVVVSIPIAPVQLQVENRRLQQEIRLLKTKQTASFSSTIITVLINRVLLLPGIHQEHNYAFI